MGGVGLNCSLLARSFSRGLEKDCFATVQRLDAAKSDFWREKGDFLYELP